MNRRIPASIVAITEELASSLAAWCGEGRGQPLVVQEAAVLARVRGVLGRLLGAVPAETTDGLDRGRRWGKTACPECGGTTAPGGWRERTLATRCGTVTLPTLRYRCGPCGQGWSGLETTLSSLTDPASAPQTGEGVRIRGRTPGQHHHHHVPHPGIRAS
jgi:hypothetical protein